MRLGFVGAGAIARRHVEVLAGHPDAIVAAVCDAQVDVAGAMAAATGATAYTDCEAMLDRKSVV